MPDFGDDAIYIWSITILGVSVPLIMTGLSLLKVHMSKARLERLKQEDEA